MIIIYIILAIIGIGIAMALLQVALKLIGYIIGIALIPGLITLVLFGNFWVGAIIGLLIALGNFIYKKNKKQEHYHTCSFCNNTDTEPCDVTQELIDSMDWGDDRTLNTNNTHRIIKCNDCGRYTIFQ